MRLGALYNAPVCTLKGERIGRVHEVYAKAGRVTMLGVGAANFLERLFAHRRGRQIAWEKVKKIERGTIFIED